MDANMDAKNEKYHSACSLAATLIETTNKLFKSQGTLQTYIDDNSVSQINTEVHALSHVYELVTTIVKVVKSIRPFLDDEAQKKSFATAADLALSKSYACVLKCYNLLKQHQDPQINAFVNDRLYSLIKTTEDANPSLILMQSADDQVKHEPRPMEVDQPVQEQVPVQQAPTPQPVPVQRPPVHQPVPVQQPFVQPPPAQQPYIQQPAPVQQHAPVQQQAYVQQPIPIQQQAPVPVQRPPPQMQQPVPIIPPNRDIEIPTKRVASPPQQQQPTGTISTSMFLEGFEKTMHDFAAKTGVAVDNFWENMLLIAAPPDRLDWVKQNLFNRKLAWRDAKQIYIQQFPDVEPAPQPNITPLSADRKRSEYVPLSNAQSSRHREARYAESLLSLEMKSHDDITAYNEKYLRFCRAANMDLNEQSLQRRYLGSLLPKHRQTIATVMKQPIQGLEELMKVASAVVHAAEGATMGRVKPYSRNCVHNQQDNSLKRSYPYQNSGSSSKRTAP